MATIAPFRGLRYAGQPLASVIAPPYDVISPEEQSRLYERSPYNVVRLELGRGPDRYAEAREAYSVWRQQGILSPDPPSMYLYEQRFTREGRGKREETSPLLPGAGQGEGPSALSTQHSALVRRGIIARLHLEEWSAGVVLPHEETLTGPKADRLQLMRTLWANVSPVFALYEDPERRLASLLAKAYQQPSLAEGADDLQELHRLWRLEEGELTQAIQQFFSGRQLFIADGHHRYETSLALREEARARGYPGADYVMTVLVDFADPGLVVLPTHRLLHNLTPRMIAALAGKLGDYFEVRAAAESPSAKALQAMLEEMSAIDGPAFGLYGPLPSGLRLIALKPELRGRLFNGRHSEAWNSLDVAILHAVVGEQILGLRDEDLAGEGYFSYTHDGAEAIRHVQHGEHQLAILLRPTPASAIRDVSLTGDKMPQKSTYFYPKLATGIVVNPLDL